MSKSFEVVLYMLPTPEIALVVGKRDTMPQARALMHQLAGKGWTLERRTDLHTFGDLVLTVRPIWRAP